MNIAKIYADATGKTERHENRQTKKEVHQEDGTSSQFVALEKEAPSAAREQVALDWKLSTCTKEMMEELGKEIDDLTNLATAKAVTYHQHNNHDEIIKLLIQASTLKGIITKYGQLT